MATIKWMDTHSPSNSIMWNSRIGKTNLQWQKVDPWLPGSGAAKGADCRGAGGKFGGWWKCFISWLIVTWDNATFIKTHQTVCLKSVHFKECKWYLNWLKKNGSVTSLFTATSPPNSPLHLSYPLPPFCGAGLCHFQDFRPLHSTLHHCPPSSITAPASFPSLDAQSEASGPPSPPQPLFLMLRPLDTPFLLTSTQVRDAYYSLSPPSIPGLQNGLLEKVKKIL